MSGASEVHNSLNWAFVFNNTSLTFDLQIFRCQWSSYLNPDVNDAIKTIHKAFVHDLV